MKIENIGFFRGPNIHLPEGGLLARLYSDNLAVASSAAHPALCAELLRRLPGLAQHQGGRMQQVMASGLLMRDLLIHVVMELLRATGYEMPRVRVLADGSGGMVEVFVSGMDEKVTAQALATAASLLSPMESSGVGGLAVIGQPAVDPEQALAAFRRLAQGGSNRDLAPLLRAAEQRGIPCYRLMDSVRFMQFGEGHKRRLVLDTLTDAQPAVHLQTALVRSELLQSLHAAGIPVPRFRRVVGHDEALCAAAELGYPVTYKQETSGLLDDSHRSGLTMAVPDETTLREVLQRNVGPNAVLSIEQVNPGRRYLNLVIDGQASMAVELGADGKVANVTLEVHPDNRRLLQRTARVAGAKILGVELIGPDIARSFREQELRVHAVHVNPRLPAYLRFPGGEEIGRLLVEQLVPAGDDGRIPLLALVDRQPQPGGAVAAQRLARLAGLATGRATVERFQVPGEDCEFTATGSVCACQAVLQDPAVEAAVVDYSLAQVATFGIDCRRLRAVLLTAQALDPAGADEPARRARDILLAAADTIVVPVAALGALPALAAGSGNVCIHALDPPGRSWRAHVDAGGQAVVALAAGPGHTVTWYRGGNIAWAAELDLAGLAARVGCDAVTAVSLLAGWLAAGLTATHLAAVLPAVGGEVVH